MAEDNRTHQIAEAVDRFIKPGEAWILRKDNDTGLAVLRQGTSSLASTSPELYGKLLKVSDQLSNAGGALCIWVPILVLILCVGLHLNWFNAVLGAAVGKLQSIWFYILATAVSFFLSGSLARKWERWKYARYRDAVLRAGDEAGLSPHRLIAEIEGDDALENLADQLKEDPHLGI